VADDFSGLNVVRGDQDVADLLKKWGDQSQTPQVLQQPQRGNLPIPQPYIDAVKGFEGFTPKASWDVNNYRNGYGTNALHPGEVIDQAEATSRLHDELGKAAGLVDAKYPDLPEGHRAALTSLTFNAGSRWMNQGLGAAVGAGDWDTAQRLFKGYNHSAGQVLPGLTNRRNSEASWLGGAVPGPGSAPPGAQKVIAGLGVPGLDPTVANVSPEGVGEARAPAAMSAVASAAAPGVQSASNADVIAKAQKALDAEKETAGERQSKGMMALAQQLLSASQAPKANFMQLAPANTGPVRPLPLNLPPFPQGFGQS